MYRIIKKPEDMINCIHCGCPVIKDDTRWWRWVGWSATGPADSSPPSPDNKKDQFDMLFHKQCFPEWLDNRNGYLQDLDRPMNNCVYFQRTGSSLFGYYVRENKKHSCFAGWLESDIFGNLLFPTIADNIRLDFPYIKIVIDDPHKWIGDFREFLRTNGWLNEGWYEPRKPFVEKDVQARLRQGMP